MASPAPIDFGRVLTPRTTERKLRGFHPYLRMRSWSKPVQTHGLRLDMSHVEYADFGAMAQICLLVEGALRHGIRVWAALPYARRRVGEERWLASLAGTRDLLAQRQRVDARVRARTRALRFMHHCGFPAALTPGHVPDVSRLVQVVQDFDSGAAGDDIRNAFQARSIDDSEPTEPVHQAGTSRRVFTLQWLTTTMDDATREDWEREAVRQLRVRGAVLSDSEADAIVGVVLRELIANVRDHAAEPEGASCPPAALVGAVAVRSTESPQVAVGDRQATAEYGRWIDETGSPVLRLIVGDSGLGICQTLALPRRDHPPAPPHGREWTTNERTLLWSLTPFSSSRKRPTASASVRGLASVRHAVGDACGALVLRSADAQAGYVYPQRQRRPIDTRPPRLAWMPGTLIDIALAPTAQSRALLAPESGGERVRVRGVAPLRLPGTREVDVDGIRAAFPRAIEEDGALMLVVGAIEDDPEVRLRHALLLLQFAEELSDHAGLVLLAIGQASVELAPLLRGLDDVRTRRREPAGMPIMVLDERGYPEWLGVTEQIARLFGAVTASSRLAVDRGTAAELLEVPEPRLDERLGRLRRWISADDNEVSLRVTPSAVATALRDALRERVGMAENATTMRAGPTEALLTPTLAAVSRWIDVSDLVSQAGGPALVGHVLGVGVTQSLTAVGNALGEDPRAPANLDAFEDEDTGLSVVCVGDVSRELQRSFQAAIGARGRVIHLIGETGRHDDPGAPFILARSRFVCLTDAMVTANHVRHAIHDLIRAGAKPLAVATVLDAREEDGPVQALGHRLPVTSLVRIPLAVPERGRTVIPVPPVQRPERVRTPPQPPPVPISAAEMRHWCSRVDDSLITGHVARLTRRHFTTFLDVQPMLAHPGFRTEAQEHVVRLLEAWTAAGDQALERLWLLHPGASHESAGRFAGLVRDAWRGRTPPIEEATPVRHVMHAGRRVLSLPNLDLDPGTGVVVCDWGAVTLHTLYELIHGAADMAATRILALVLSSQVSSEDELVAARLRSVAGRAFSPEELHDGASQRVMRERAAVIEAETPAEIRFLTRFQVGYATPGECALCRHAEGYVELASRAPSGLLAEHAEGMARGLEPTELDTARGDLPRDALGKPITHREVVALVEFREKVRAARNDTDHRRRLRDEIAAMRGEEIDAAVRALALEPSWLKLPPLRFDSLRETVADALERRLRDPELERLSASLRRQYILVLRAASKRRFLAQVPALIPLALRASDGVPVATQVLDGVHSLVRRAYHSNDDDLRRIANALRGAATNVASDASLAATPGALRVQAALSSVLAETEYRRRLVKQRGLTTHEAWLQLHSDYLLPVVRHTVETDVASIEGAIRSRRMRGSAYWQRMLTVWQGVQHTLVSLVLPNLRVARDPVLEYIKGVRPDKEALTRVSRACSDDVLTELADVEAMLTSFAADPVQALNELDDLERQVGWWHRFFFIDDGRGLLEIVRSCPSNLWNVVEEALASTDPKSRAEDVREVVLELKPPSRDLQVFCHPFVIRRTVHHLILNARQMKHAAPAAGRHDPVRILISATAKHGTALLRVRNTGSQPTPVPGAGLAELAQLLSAYGGLLGPTPPVSPWTYDVSVKLPLWESVT